MMIIYFTAVVLSHTHHAENMLSFHWLPWSVQAALSDVMCLPVFRWRKLQLYFFHIRGPVLACHFFLLVGNFVCILVHLYINHLTSCISKYSVVTIFVQTCQSLSFIIQSTLYVCCGLKEVIHFDVICWISSVLCQHVCESCFELYPTV